MRCGSRSDDRRSAARCCRTANPASGHRHCRRAGGYRRQSVLSAGFYLLIQLTGNVVPAGAGASCGACFVPSPGIPACAGMTHGAMKVDCVRCEPGKQTSARCRQQARSVPQRQQERVEIVRQRVRRSERLHRAQRLDQIRTRCRFGHRTIRFSCHRRRSLDESSSVRRRGCDRTDHCSHAGRTNLKIDLIRSSTLPHMPACRAAG